MTYAPTDWVDGVTPVDAAHMDKIEAGILAAEEKAAKGVASGYAPLDSGSKLPNANLPARIAPGASAINAANLDSIIESGWYSVSAGATGLPDPAINGLLQHIAYDAGSGVHAQLLYDFASHKSWKRYAYGSWIAWVQLTDAAGRSTLPLLLSGDANLYRVAASTLQTDGHLHAGYDVVARKGNVAGQIQLSDQGAGTRIYFGTALDTNLYRDAASVLKTDQSFRVGNYLDVDYGGSGAKLRFGSGVDTNLYRQAAGILKTDGILNAVGGLQVNGVPVGGSSIPPRLDIVCQTITDWNTAKDNGWYMGSGAANAPTAGVWYYGFVIQHNSAWVTQEVVAFAGDYRRFQRNLESGTWGPWTPLPQGAQYGSWTTPAMSNGSPYSVRINFAFPFRSTPVVMATLKSWTNSQQVYVAANNVSTTGFDFYAFNVVNNGNTCVVDWLALA